MNGMVYVLDRLTNQVSGFDMQTAMRIIGSNSMRFKQYNPDIDGMATPVPPNMFGQQNNPNMMNANMMNQSSPSNMTYASSGDGIMGIRSPERQNDMSAPTGNMRYRSTRKHKNENVKSQTADQYQDHHVDEGQYLDKGNFEPIVPFGCKVTKVPVSKGQYTYVIQGKNMLNDTDGKMLFDLDTSIGDVESAFLISAYPGTIHNSPAALFCEAASIDEKAQAVTITLLNAMPYLIPEKLETTLQAQLIEGTKSVKDIHTRFTELREKYSGDKVYHKYFDNFNKMMTKRINSVIYYAMNSGIRMESFDADYLDVIDHYMGLPVNQEETRKFFHMYMLEFHKALLFDANTDTFEDIKKETYQLDNKIDYANGRQVEYFYETLNVIYINTNDQPYLGNDVHYERKYEITEQSYPSLHGIISRAILKNHNHSRMIMVVDGNDFDVIITTDKKYIVEKI